MSPLRDENEKEKEEQAINPFLIYSSPPHTNQISKDKKSW